MTPSALSAAGAILSQVWASGAEPDPRYRQDDDPDHPWTPADARRFIVAYDGAIAYLDAEPGCSRSWIDGASSSGRW
jgi:hypothetical protein